MFHRPTPPAPAMLAAALLAVLLLALPDHAGGRESRASPLFEVRLTRAGLEAAGSVASDRHRAAIIAVARAYFASPPPAEALEWQRAGLPPYWEAASLATLGLLATLEAGKASLSPSGIQLEGVSTRPEAFRASLAALRDVLPGSVGIHDDVTLIAVPQALDTLCAQAFDRMSEVRIEFQQASAELRTSAHGLLDRLIEFAFNCPGARIVVTGHTDDRGDEAWNLQLSLMRARSVADYLVAGGVGLERLRVDGRGSTDPVADNGTEIGRRMNRRIEFALE